MPREFHGWAGNYITRWMYLRVEVQEAFDHEMACLTRAMRDNTFDGLVFNRPPRYTKEH